MTQEFTLKIRKSDIPQGRSKVFLSHGIQIALTEVEGTYYAFLDLCTHRDEPLSSGCLKGTVIECPFHGAKFDLRDGRALCAPAKDSLPVFKIEDLGDTLLVDLDEVL
ncbi:MAG: Rieske 2Fe-2S domain-containing protein [Deltaproteobacteria bacterium]|nr:Rieske 2Fe-2S domain-containing protein [Deltaproteobacteria bacterium]